MLTKCQLLTITATSIQKKLLRTENFTQVWLGGDHYKWRQMRTNGVDEKYITGDASDREKFQKWAETLEMAIGNPLYRRYSRSISVIQGGSSDTADYR